MKKRKLPLPEHVISAMRRDDGYIMAKTIARGVGGVQYVVYVLTTEGYKSLCAISYSQMNRLYKEGYIKHVGDGKWKLTDKGKEEDDEK